jgi:hypothetical protein
MACGAQAKVFAGLSLGKFLRCGPRRMPLTLISDLGCTDLEKKRNVEKRNCMTGEFAQAVAFSKIKNDGPFCLTSYSDYACEGDATTQQYDIAGSKSLCYYHRLEIPLYILNGLRLMMADDNIAKVCRPIEHRGKSYSTKKVSSS